VVHLSFFKHYRPVKHQDGTSSMAWAEMKKTIYSPDPLRQLLLVANRRTNGKNSGQVSRTMKAFACMA